MPNKFVDRPPIIDPRGPDMWECPITKFNVPKIPDENLQWRAKLIAKAEQDEGLQKALWQASSASILFWINAFVFTYRVQFTDHEGKARPVPPRKAYIPFVTWTRQDEHILKVQDAIRDGHHLLTDKSRDMGASWDHLAAIHHEWLTAPDSLFLELSRVETDVDDADNPRSLMAKHDIINRFLPLWMRPPGCLDDKRYRKRLHIVNSLNGSRIDGESSNKAAGSGDRRKAVLLDEMAKMEHGERIKGAMMDVTPCMLPNSTPWGPGTAYSRWRNSNQIEVFELPWWYHPEKSRGLYVEKIEETGEYRYRSPWYDIEATKRSPQEMAQEVDLNHIDSGATFFEGAVIERHKKLFGRRPRTVKSVDFERSVKPSDIPKILARGQYARVRLRSGRQLRIWTPLINGRLDQTKNYIIGCDISKGQGASNSVASIRCIETNEKVAEWSDANTPPYEFARIVCALALWTGGSRRNGRPLVIWEANGAPGWDFGRQFVKIYRYPVYYKNKAVQTTAEKQTKKYGWHSSAPQKAIALGNYRRALAHNEFLNHSEEALDEALTYVHYNNGNIGPAALVAESDSARKCHGDRVIADMLTLIPEEKGAGTQRQGAPVPANELGPENSIGGRMRRRLQARQRQRRKGTKLYDFRKPPVGVM